MATSNQIALGNLYETKRANVARETESHRTNVANENLRQMELSETHRHNVVYETETNRHNLATESIGQQQIQLGYAQVNLGYAQLAETSRHNQQQEQIGRTQQSINLQQFSENKRHNIAMEGQTQWYQQTSTDEVHRHNVATERIQSTGATAQIIRGIGEIIPG